MKRWLVAASLATRLAAADPAEPITFGDAIRRAIAQNPDRRIALDEIARVDGLLRQATAALLPQLAAGAAYTRLEGDRFINTILTADANSVLADVTITAPIVDFHAIAERRRARDQVDVTTDDADSTKRAVAIATARAYFVAYTTARQSRSPRTRATTRRGTPTSRAGAIRPASATISTSSARRRSSRPTRPTSRRRSPRSCAPKKRSA